MNRKKRQLLETINGHGDIYEGDKPISVVAYSIQIFQDMHLVGNQRIPGMKDILGNFALIDGERDLVGKSDLVLHLEDGRQWKCIISRGDFIKGNYRALNAAGSTDLIPDE